MTLYTVIKYNLQAQLRHKLLITTRSATKNPTSKVKAVVSVPSRSNHISLTVT